jgi:hypothetical protein
MGHFGSVTSIVSKAALVCRHGIAAICCPLVFVALNSATNVHADATSMPSYMNCARAIGVSQSDKFAVIAGERPAGKGIYIFTDSNAYFLALGAPHVESAEMREFFFRFRRTASESEEIYLSFQERKAGSQSQVRESVAYQMTPPAEYRLNLYRNVALIDALDGRAIQSLSQRLRERVGRIKSFIDDKNSFSTPLEASVAFYRDRNIYRTKLEHCRIDGDRELQLAVADEMQKLANGFPGPTIWELQIDGKSQSAKAR